MYGLVLYTHIDFTILKFFEVVVHPHPFWKFGSFYWEWLCTHINITLFEVVVHPHLHICRQIFLIHPRSKCVFLLVEGKSGCGCDDCENERKFYSLDSQLGKLFLSNSISKKLRLLTKSYWLSEWIWLTVWHESSIVDWLLKVYDDNITNYHHPPTKNFLRTLELNYTQVWYIIGIVLLSPSYFYTENIGLI